MIFSQVNQHSSSTAAISGPTEAAVTDPSAWWALPLLTRHNEISQTWPTHTHQIRCEHNLSGTHRIQQSISDLLSVAVTETGAAELTPHSHTLWVTAVGFGVGCFLAALVASGSLKIRGKFVSIAKRSWQTNTENLFSITVKVGPTVTLLYTFSRTLLQMFCSSNSVMSSTGRTSWGIALEPLKERRRSFEWNKRNQSECNYCLYCIFDGT